MYRFAAARQREMGVGNWFRRKKHPLASAEEDIAAPSEAVIGELESNSLVDGLKKLRSEAGAIPIKYSLDRIALFDWGDEFQPQRYLDVFRLVSIDSGYVLDYVYEWHGIGGHPLLYARKTDEPRIASVEAYRRKFGNLKSQYLSHLSFEKVPLGWFQFAFLCLEAPKFYLSWHDNYYDVEFVCSHLRVQEILQGIPSEASIPLESRRVIQQEDRDKLDALALNPRVTIRGNVGKVTAVAFTKWGGFSYYNTELSWPNKVLNVTTETIVPYNCGIVY